MNSKETIRIVDFESKYHKHFKTLNEAWINEFFTIEEPDREMLNDPQGYILARGGVIKVALEGDQVVGVCALVPWHGDQTLFDYELAKMAVSPVARGRGIGESLGRAILQAAQDKGARRIYLETNSILASALRLYKRMGFQEITGCETPYTRCNTQMEYVIE
jgi:GNAT superfamily N-acetyltransferase